MLSPTTWLLRDDPQKILFPAKPLSLRSAEEFFDQLASGALDGAAVAKRGCGVDRMSVDSRCNARAQTSLEHGAHVVLRVNSFRGYPDRRQALGYWDFYRLSPQVILSVAEIRYREDAHFEVPGENVLKIRLLLAGRILSADRKTLLQGPGAVVSFHGNNAGADYYIASGTETKLIILHCRPRMLAELFGFGGTPLPPPFDRLAESKETQLGKSLSISLTAPLVRAATDILTSRDCFDGVMQSAYLYAKCLELLSIIAQNCCAAERMPVARRGLKKQDVRRVTEAQGILLQQFAQPPSMERLARILGTNQTRLGAAFKAITGETVFGYIHRRRMERASELLLSGERSVNEVAYEVGYSFPANFTMAFKRHFGYLPKVLKSRSAKYPA